MLVYQRVCSTFSRHRRSKSKMATPSSHAPPWSLFRLVLNGFTRLKFSTLPRAPISGLSDLPSVQTSSERNCWGRESRSYWRRNWRYASLKFQRCAFELLMIQICPAAAMALLDWDDQVVRCQDLLRFWVDETFLLHVVVVKFLVLNEAFYSYIGTAPPASNSHHWFAPFLVGNPFTPSFCDWHPGWGGRPNLYIWYITVD